MLNKFRGQPLVLAIGVMLSQPALALDYTWLGGTGNWITGTMWDLGSFPNSSTANVFIDGGKTGINSVVTLTGGIDAANVTVDLGDNLRIANGALINIYANLSNNGQMDMTGGTAVLRVANNTTFSGTGRVVLGGDGNNHIQSIFGQSGNRLINGPGHTIEGAGNIGGIGMKLTNQGLILANNLNPLTIDPNDDADGMINTGILRAQDGARLILQHGIFTNTGATIEALDASFVDFASGVTITGGTLSTAGSGLVRSLAATQNTLTDVTLAGKLQVQNGSILNLSGTFTNPGQVDMTGGVAVIRIANDTTFAGSGRVVMGGNGDNHIQAMIGQAGNRLINGPAHTIEGGGAIGGGSMKLTNHGLILANSVNPLVIATANAPDGFFNQGTVRVEATRTMTFGAGSNMVQDGASARTEVNGTLNVPLLDLQAGMLTGSGIVNGPVASTGGIVAPGSALGTLTVGNFTQGALGILAIELENLGSHDLLLVNGTAALDGTVALSCFAACSFSVGDEFVILDATGNLTGTFGTGVTLSGFATGAFDVVYDTTLDEVRLRVSEEVTAVPEPGSWAMLLAGLGLVGYAARRRRRM